MKIFNMTREDFKQIPTISPEQTTTFSSLVIIPTEEIHYSGWRCMEFVAVDKKGEPMYKMSGYSDVLHIDGIGGYGEHDWRTVPTYVEAKGWSFDCLPCGYLRLMCNCDMKYGGGISDFQIYGVK